jgi:hypothetical protein
LTPSEGTAPGHGWDSLNSSIIEGSQEDSEFQEGSTLKDQEEPNTESIKRRSASRLIRAYRKLAYELKQMSGCKAKEREGREESL